MLGFSHCSPDKTGPGGGIAPSDENFLARYGGFGGAMKRLGVLYKMPEAKTTEGVSIDDYSTWRAVRFADRDEVG